MLTMGVLDVPRGHPSTGPHPDRLSPPSWSPSSWMVVPEKPEWLEGLMVRARFTLLGSKTGITVHPALPLLCPAPAGYWTVLSAQGIVPDCDLLKPVSVP